MSGHILGIAALALAAPRAPFATRVGGAPAPLLHCAPTRAAAAMSLGSSRSEEGESGQQQTQAPPRPRVQLGMLAIPELTFRERVSNMMVNQALLIGVLSLTAYGVLTVDASEWRGWYPLEILFRIPADNWKAYEIAVAAKPLPVKAAITGVSYLIGDWIAQGVELSKRGASWLDADRPRLARSLAVGLLLLGPLAHNYYDFVADAFAGWSPPQKIALDQTLYLATYNTIYYIALGLFAGRPAGETTAEYLDKFWSLMFAAWKLWPLVGVVTYTLIPIQHRVLFIDLIEIIYSAVLSTVANEGAKDDAAEVDVAPS